MKANEAPDKIYLEKVYPDNGVLPNGLNYYPSPTDIEYTRTDVFIYKVYEWVNAHILDYAFYEPYLGGVVINHDLFSDLKKAMKGE